MNLVNHWVKHPELLRIDELLILLYRMRMATSQNIADLMGLSMRTVRESLLPQLLNQKNVILSHRLKSRQKAYYLGVEGCKRVGKLLNKKINFYDYTGSQARHFEGINSILGRIVRRIGVNAFKEETEWYFTRQARDLIQKEWGRLLEGMVNAGELSQEEAIAKIDALPEPDARFIYESAYWLEFDNDTESKGKIIEKMIDYIETLVAMENHDEIVWVVTRKSPTRRDKLAEWWKEAQNAPSIRELEEGYGDEFFIPSMRFFVEGEETDFLLQPTKQTT